MKLNRNIFAIILSIILTTAVLPVFLAIPAMGQTQDADIALQRGYRTGYSDGYMAGYKDAIDSLTKDYARHADYTKADRTYSKDLGPIEDFRDGYQQGFESGYDTGFEKRSFEPNLPTNLNKRGAPVNQNAVSTTNPAETASTNEIPATYQTNNAIVIIPRTSS